MDTTEWLDGAEKPARPGVYQRNVATPPAEPFPAFSRWDGVQWRHNGMTADEAEESNQRSLLQAIPWRGLTEEQPQ